MTEEEMKSKITQAHTDGYNKGFAKAEEKIADLEKANEMQALRIKECNELLLELKAQIEKMKCCGNCKQRELIREHGQWKERFNCKGNGCVCYNKWSLKNE